MVPETTRWAAACVAAVLACGALADEKRAEKRDELLSAVLAVQASIAPKARSAATLGTERRGSGALIREGLVLTIGYLVIEAQSVNVGSPDGRVVPATVAAYDHASGLALLKLLAPLPGKPLPLGDSAALAERSALMAVSAAAVESPQLVYVVSRRQFSGSWEYLLDSAIFTYPPLAEWSGAPLIGPKGELLGIGSLMVPDAAGQGTQSPGNLFVPVDLLAPVLEELVAQGRRKAPARPWLGVNAEELRGHVLVVRLSPEGPAQRAGLKEGDIVIGVGGDTVRTLADFYRRVWARGPAGARIPLRVLQGAEIREIVVRSIDRQDYFRPSASY